MSNFLHSLFNFLEIATQDITHVGESVCTEPGVMKALRLVGYIILVLKFLVPVILILWGTFDIYKAVIAGESDSLKKQFKAFLIRVGIALTIFLLPGAINLVISSIHDEVDDNAMCAKCLLEPLECDV